ncbi:MAG: hypothetical protein RLZZ292_473 [Bacteroidota bacterium]
MKKFLSSASSSSSIARAFFVGVGMLCFFTNFLVAQNTTIEGYVYESDNRGYIQKSKITVVENKTGFVRGETESDIEGRFTIAVPSDVEYKVTADHKVYFSQNTIIYATGEKVYAKIKLTRRPGYIFDVTLARDKEGKTETDALTGVRVEAYNNTTQQEILKVDSSLMPNLSFNMEQGNHYTMLLRRQGYFNKRVEAYVNIKGCILCIDGIDKVKPGVSDNLSAGSGFQMGTLLANIEMQPLALNQTIQIKNIYYDLSKADLRPESRKELDKIITVLKINPAIRIELGSHTDSRGDSTSNMSLSQRRAESCVNYILANSNIDKNRITAKGYGESHLVNRCGDGIPCSEAEHQNNRRTELRITGFDKDPYQDKSLVDIIREENIEKGIQTLGVQKTVEVKEGDDMPEDLKRYIESQKNGSGSSNSTTTNSINTNGGGSSTSNSTSSNTSTSSSVTSSSSSNTSVQTTTSTMHTTQKAEEVIIKKIEPTIIKKEVPITKIEETSGIITKPKEKKKEKGNKEKMKKEEVKTTTTIKESVKTTATPVATPTTTATTKITQTTTTTVVTTPTETSTTTHSQKSDSVISKIIQEREVAVKPTSAKFATNVPSNYNGYKIEILTANQTLPATDPIYNRYQDLIVQKTEKGVAYLVGGDLKTRAAAEDYFRSINKRYPKAKIIVFVEGKRVK